MKENKLLLIPGPTPVVGRILEALALPTVSHTSPEMEEALSRALNNIKKIVFTERGQPFIVSGAGTLAMEIALLNITSPSDKVLVLSQGYFGSRMAEICETFGIKHSLLQSQWGRVVTAEELKAELKRHKYEVVVCTHVDTATGSCAPVHNYAEVLRQVAPEALLVVDGVCATGGIEERMDDWGIDVILTAAQKCLGAPPGLAIDVFSERAMEKRKKLPGVKAYYADIMRWLPVMENPNKYFSTPGVNEIRAFYEATKIVIEEGLERRFERHERFAAAIRNGLRSLGFSTYTDETCLASTLSVIRYPEGLEDLSFRKKLSENGLVVAGGLGSTTGQVFRVGHMGNLTREQIVLAFDAIEKSLLSLGFAFSLGDGVETIRSLLVR
ncbi:MAG: alanine--glyoxylate aminotransferase family protein [Acidobacteriota bacterium]|nr:alanine--glyoxylate aminotransferase family protein [Acidobacteriota bacterium]MDW3228689.1 alanine--glyoxylate aminotransferase family protein [Acidobacteriota bacterium]MDY0232169.1 alanine--glyoxylate aminotransferase family protein [Candidatus Saccharicenans sp.]